MELTGTSAFSVSAWARSNNIDNNAILFSKSKDTNEFIYLQPGRTSDNTVKVLARNAESSTGTYTPSTELQSSTWYHYVYVFNGSGLIKF